MKLKSLAAKAALVVVLTAGPLTAPVKAGIPVFDGANLMQNIMTALESVAQTLKQIEQYRTQLQQYENMIQNTIAPAAYIWDQAQLTIRALMNAVDTLNYYKNQVGSIDAYLAKFQDVAYYRGSPCFTPAGCSEWERAAMEQNRALASQSQKKANDALFRGLDQQQTNLRKDAATLQRLQAGAQSANGQMEALGYANQLASHQANQLLQLRGLLMAQHNATGTQMQAASDRAAQEAASAEQLRKGSYRDSPLRTW